MQSLTELQVNAFLDKLYKLEDGTLQTSLNLTNYATLQVKFNFTIKHA
jgi:hypothetical protein